MDENIRHGETMDFEVNVRSVETFKDFQKLCWDHVKEQMGIAQNVDVENISLVLKGSEVMLPNEDFLSTHHHYLNEQHSMLGPGEEAYPQYLWLTVPLGNFLMTTCMRQRRVVLSRDASLSTISSRGGRRYTSRSRSV